MSVKCSRTFTLSEDTGGCPVPVPVTFGIPDAPNKTLTDFTTENYFEFTAIDGTQKIARIPETLSDHCIEIVDFSAVPAVVSTFQLNGETGWRATSVIYEPTSNELVVFAYKGADGACAFFDPDTGYISHTATTIPVLSFPVMSVLMRGANRKIAAASFGSGIEGFGAPAYITIVSTQSRSILSTFTLSESLGDVFSYASFDFSCQRNEFYLQSTSGNLYCISATDGTTNRTIPNVNHKFCYCDLDDHIITATELEMLDIIDPDDGTILSSVDISTDYLGNLYWIYVESIRYNFKLNSIEFVASIELDSDNSYSGVLFAANPTNCAYIDHCVCHNEEITGSYPRYLHFNETTGDAVFFGLAERVVISDPDVYTFYQVRATIT